MGWIENLEPHWTWLALGLMLGVAEMIIPGVFLIWLAGAAIITGLLTLVLPIGIPLQIVTFAALAIVSVFVGRRYLRDNPILEADPKMNRRGQRMVGDTVVVVSPIVNGRGRVRHGDSEWIAKGEDAAAGDRVRITGSDGAVLLVEPIDAPLAEALPEA